MKTKTVYNLGPKSARFVIFCAVCDGTQNFKRYRYFFPVPIIFRYRYRYFLSVPNLPDTGSEIFFRYQILPILVPRLFRYQTFQISLIPRHGGAYPRSPFLKMAIFNRIIGNEEGKVFKANQLQKGDHFQRSAPNPRGCFQWLGTLSHPKGRPWTQRRWGTKS